MPLLRFVAAAATGREAAARRALRALAGAGARRRAEEAALMLVLYAGYPAALESLGWIRDLWPGSAAPPSARRAPGTERRAGLALCRRVYGRQFPRLLARVRALHPDLARWMIEEGYGRVLSRPRLGARERELLTVAALAALGWERPLLSHLLGARRLGARSGGLRRALELGRRSARDARARTAASRAWRAACARIDRGKAAS